MNDDISYSSLGGRIVTFRNRPGVYPVNDYQSLVLAVMAEIAAMGIALRAGRNVSGLSAWEPCCGGGPAAIALKAFGVGYVQATDMSQPALDACRSNATLNGVTIDRIVDADLLADGSERTFDVICCNPPCGVQSIVGGAPTEGLRHTKDGGPDGMDVSVALVDQATRRLSAIGSLILIVVSTGHIARLKQVLDERFPGRWRVLPPTPVAAPWRRADDPAAARITGEPFAPFVWERPDGWLWRLSWVVEASMVPACGLPAPADAIGMFPLHPFAFEPSHDGALLARLREAGDGALPLRD